MSGLVLNDIDYEKQDEFLDNTYSRLPERFVYVYLFEGPNLHDLEIQVLNLEEDTYRGFVSKFVLNNLGIDTSGRNRGIFKGKDIDDVVEGLMSSFDPRMHNIGWVLREYAKNEQRAKRNAIRDKPRLQV